LSLVLAAGEPDPDPAAIGATLTARAPAGAPSVDLLVLPRLPQVEFMDIDDWVGECRGAPPERFGELDIPMLRSSALRLFGATEEPQPMRTVYAGLVDALREAYRGPKFG
jgi:hypothetical protein